MDSVVALDQDITLAINGIWSPESDAVWGFISGTKLWYLLYLLAAALMIWKLGWKKGLVMILAIGLSILCIDQLCNLVKDTVCRLRPSNDPDMMARGLHCPFEPYKNHIYGFFSAHAANSFGFAAGSFLALKSGRGGKAVLSRLQLTAYGLFVFIWATLVALSRVFLARHYFGDILVGAVIGILIAWALVALGNLLVDRNSRSRD